MDILERMSVDDQLSLRLARRYVHGAHTSSKQLELADATAESCVARLQHHGLVPIAHAGVTAGDLRISALGSSTLRQSHLTSVAKSLVVEQEFRALAASLNEHGLHPVIWKGPAAAAWYIDTHHRPYDDVDILLSEDEWPAFKRAMSQQLDAKPITSHVQEQAPLLPGETLDHSFAFRTPGGLNVDCAFDPYLVGIRAREVGVLLSRCRVEDVEGISYRVMSPEDSLITLCTHLNRHGFARLIWFVDIGLLLRQSEIDWQLVSHVARAQGLSTALRLTLQHVDETVGCSVPMRALSALRMTRTARYVWNRTWPREHLLRFEGVHEGPLVFNQVLRPSTSLGWLRALPANVALTGRFAEKAIFAARALFPPYSFLASRRTVNADGAGYVSLWAARVVGSLLRGKGNASLRASRSQTAPANETSGQQAILAEELSRKVARGFVWTMTGNIASRGSQFFVMMLLARLLLPDHFGLVGMAATVTMLVSMLMESGFGQALIQRAEIDHRDVNTALWANVFLGFGLAAACAWFAPAISGLFSTPELTPVLRLAAIVLLVNAFRVVPVAVLSRRFEFRSIAKMSIAGSVAYGAIAIGLAVAGAGVWSLVVAGLASAIVELCTVWPKAALPIALEFHIDRLRQLASFSWRMLGANLLNYMRANLDYFIVGAALGPKALGLYTIAFKLVDFPGHRLATMVTDVALPAISRLQYDADAVRVAYARAVSATTLLAFPLLIGLAVLSREFILAAFGTRWIEAVGLLRILLPMGLLMAITAPGVTVLLAKGRPGTYMWLSGLYTAAVALFADAGIRYGLSGVSAGVAVASVVYAVACQLELKRHAGISVGLLFKSLLPASAASIVMALCVVASALVFAPSDASAASKLLGGIAVGGLSYFVSLMVVAPSQLREAVAVLRGLRQEASSAKTGGAVHAERVPG